MTSESSAGESSMDAQDIVEKLHSSVQSFIKIMGHDNIFAQNLLQKIESMQKRIEHLTGTEKSKFLENMKDSFHSTIEKIEQKLMQHAKFQQARNYSMYAALIFVIVMTFGTCHINLYSFYGLLFFCINILHLNTAP